MNRLLEFLRGISLLLLFVVLEGAAILFYAHSNSYVQAKILGYSADVTGSIGAVTGGVESYLSLREKNEELVQRVVSLERELQTYRMRHTDSILLAHSRVDSNGMYYVSARVVRNSLNKSKNYILINRGLQSGIREKMAVLTTSGAIVGWVVACTDRYSVVISLLNSEFSSSGKLLGGNYAGSLSWNGESSYRLQLSDVSKYAKPFVGAQVITSGLSQIFPAGFKIGRVAEYERSEVDGSYRIEVELDADMKALGEVVVINSLLLSEADAIFEEFNRTGSVGFKDESFEEQSELPDEFKEAEETIKMEIERDE